MSFFREWNEKKQDIDDDVQFVVDFLMNKEEAISVLQNGNKDELNDAFNILNAYSVDRMIELLSDIELKSDFSPADVPCFSTMANGMVRLNELLEFNPNGMKFSEIGYQMKKQTNDFACIKYGENHAKLAAMMNLVRITNTRPAIITSTAIGHFLVKYQFEQKRNILKTLLLQDRFIQYVIAISTKGDIKYSDIVPFLKPSTAYRRKTSVKQLIDFLLSNTTYYDCYDRIDWKV